MLRIARALWLAAAVVCTSCGTDGSHNVENAVADAAPAADSPNDGRIAPQPEAGAQPANPTEGDIAPAVALFVEEQRDALDKLRFDFELLKEDVKQRDMWLKERDVSSTDRGRQVGKVLVQFVEEKLARVRADGARLARAVTDAQLAQDLKTDVLDPLELLAKSCSGNR